MLFRSGKLGKHSTGKGCLYIKRLADVDEKGLKTLIESSVKVVEQPTKPAGVASKKK